jgi:hypothetical protein
MRRPKSLALIRRVIRRVVTPRQWIVAGSLKVRAEEPVWSTRIAAGEQNVIVELAIADRDLGPSVEVRTPSRDHDHAGAAGAVRDDRCGRLDDRAARLAASAGITDAAMKPLNAVAISGGRTTDTMSFPVDASLA